MAEAFAALSIAANIAQFVDYAKQLILSGKEIYNSLDGARDEHQALKVIIENIKNATDEFQSASSDPNPSNDEVRFRKLAAECEPVADKLLAILKDLEVPSGVRFRGLQTMRQTFRGAAKKKDIQDLQRRLTTIDVQLRDGAARMLQKKHYTGITSAINSLTQANERLKVNTNLTLEKMKEDLVCTLQKQRDRVEKEQLTHLENLSEGLYALAKEGQQVVQQQAILQTLLFEEILQREETIKDAHKTTLDWMFDKDKTKFTEWLEFEKGIYWVKGKAGSGKSTLMKYICNHKTTLEILRRWAGTEQLFTASFFFWNSGYPMQKSQVGLLQSLLYQVLRAWPKLIMQVCLSKNLREPWKRNKLFEALDAISKQTTLPGKFCFFVDGLDEYEGDDEDIISLLQDLASSPRVKICVSSRPWNAFLDAFDDSEWKLVLEDLTRNDMRKYVQTMLVQNEAYRKISEEDPRCETLVPQIAQKAQGVWLWVYLVIRDLLRDLKAEEEYPLLQRRLDSFPNELERYFEDIFNRIDKIHREETARIFLLAITAFRPFPVLSLHYLGMEATNKDYAIHMGISRISTQNVFRIKKKWKKLLNSRCRDLLVVDDPCNCENAPYLAGKVYLLHRTVGDFLRSNYSDELRRRAGEGFDAGYSLCKTVIALSKVSADRNHPKISEGFVINIPDFDLVDEMLYHAKNYERIEARSLAVLLDELDRVNTIRTNSKHIHWTNKRWFFPLEYSNCTFLAQTIQAGLRIYVKEKLELDQMLVIQKRGCPLLYYACRHRHPHQLFIDPQMVRILLEHGADPNQPTGNTPEGKPWLPVWGSFLFRCYNQKTPSESLRNEWYEIIELMIDHGADPNAKVQRVDRSKKGVPLRAQRAAPGTVQDLTEGAIAEVEDERTIWSVQTMLESIFGADRAARLALRMEEYAQRGPSTTSNSTLALPKVAWME